MANYAVLGASDPEMSAIETLLRECGVTVTYAAVDGVRVHAGNAYATGQCSRNGQALWEALATHSRETGTAYPAISRGLHGAPETTSFVDVDVLCVETSPPRIDPELYGYGGFLGPLLDCAVADHHRPGDSGHGRPPSEFLTASSLGQVIAWLARHADLPHVVFGSLGAVGSAAGTAGSVVYHHQSRAWCVVDKYRTLRSIPRALVLTAAADHCLGAAYRGECPGVDPDELMEWRVQSRAQFQGVSPETILVAISAAREELQAAEVIPLLPPDGCGDAPCFDDAPDYHAARVVADMRCDTPIPELPEAATRDGVSYISGPLIGPDGRRKFTCSGTTEVVEAFMRIWGPANGLIDIYGDPTRGFAGGYSC